MAAVAEVELAFQASTTHLHLAAAALAQAQAAAAAAAQLTHLTAVEAAMLVKMANTTPAAEQAVAAVAAPGRVVADMATQTKVAILLLPLATKGRMLQV